MNATELVRRAYAIHWSESGVKPTRLLLPPAVWKGLWEECGLYHCRATAAGDTFMGMHVWVRPGLDFPIALP